MRMRNFSLSRPRPVAMDADKSSLTLLSHKSCNFSEKRKLTYRRVFCDCSFECFCRYLSSVVLLELLNFELCQPSAPPSLLRSSSKMGCVNCKPSRSSLYAVEKEKKRFSKRRNKKSISSLIRKLFGKKNRRDVPANNPTEEGESRENEAAVDGVAQSSDEVSDGVSSLMSEGSEATVNVNGVDVCDSLEGEGEIADGEDVLNECGMEEKTISKDSGIVSSIEEMMVDDSGAISTKTKVGDSNKSACR